MFWVISPTFLRLVNTIYYNNFMRQPEYLRVYPIVEFGFGEYQYFVDTPDAGTMYFKNKPDARKFIEFYKTYKDKSTKCIETN